MTFNFRSIPIGELCQGIYDGPHATPAPSDSGAIFLGISNFVNGKLNLSPSNIRYISEEDYPKWTKRVTPKAHDIVFSYEATLNLYAIIPDGFRGCLGRRMALMRPDEGVVDYRFLYYYMFSPAWREEVERYKVNGSTVDRIPLVSFPSFRVDLPNMRTQKAIADILFAIDQKIDSNSRVNDNLQQQAQAIYSSMFIDNSESAWTHGHLSDLVTVKYGKDHKKLSEGIYPVYGSGGIMRYVERPLYDKESVLIPRKGTLNNVMYVNQPFWSVDTMFYTEMKLPNVAKFVYHFVKAKDLASMNAGSAVPSMTTDILNAMEVVIPSASALEEFEALVAPMYEAMEANDVQSQALSKVRDTLLPKLMSGEIDVSSVLL